MGEAIRSRAPGAALWGIVGVLAILAQAVWRLTPLAVEPIATGMMTPPLWAVWVSWVALQCWSEGYVGFQRQFSPRVVARAFHLADHPRPSHVILAPLFCMAFFHATRRRLVTSYGLAIGIVILVIIVHAIPQPWRGIIDAGVVIGMVWGMAAIVVFAFRGFAGASIPADPDLP